MSTDMTITLPCPIGCVHAHMHRLMHWRDANGIYGCNQSGAGWSDQDQATEDANLVTCPPCLAQMPPIIQIAATLVEWPNPDSWRIGYKHPEAWGDAPGTHRTAPVWPTAGESLTDAATRVLAEVGYIAAEAWRVVPERPGGPAYQTCAARPKSELVTFATEAARHIGGPRLSQAVTGYAKDLAKRDQDAAEGRCEACKERVMFDDPHANLCPLDPDTLEEAGERVRAITSADELDARGAELRRCNGGPSAFPACGKTVEANGYCVDHSGCARCAASHPHAADRHNYGAGCVHAPSR